MRLIDADEIINCLEYTKVSDRSPLMGKLADAIAGVVKAMPTAFDADEYKAQVDAEHRHKTIEEVKENIIPVLYEHDVHQATIDICVSLLEQLEEIKE